MLLENGSGLEVDSGFDDDSCYTDDSISSFESSITPSVKDYPHEHGRRYHGYRPGVYILPNDEAEMARLDLSHLMFQKLLNDRLYLAPLESPKRILDLGSGTGIWALEMGETFPNAEILGNDLTPIEPLRELPNVTFEVDDVEDLWVHNKPFDFIFSRYMAASISDWRAYIENIYNHTSPGGWVEFQDYEPMYASDDGSLRPEHHTYKWICGLIEASKKNGREPNVGPMLESLLLEAGFENVQHYQMKVPVGPWPKNRTLKEVGLFNLVQILNGVEAFSLRLYTQVLGWSFDELQSLLKEVSRELRSGTIHSYHSFHVIYGQRPKSG
ncbi:hypothetical protein FQN54_008008 [Arachnomyces sp. PD_36]|nr:hypothetical protein FQN54_008008 [Arachnomyces sp. PD_36]